GCFTFRGAVLDAAGESVDEVDLLVTVMGACTVPLEAPFVGTVHARESSIILATVAQPGHIGSFFGRDVELHQDTQVTHRAFPWDAVLPRQNRSWSPSPVELTSRNEPDSGASAQTTAQLPEPIPFRIPEYLHVDTGNAGMG